MDSKKVYIVPHSHWDREWYFTIEDSNIILAENMSHLLTVLKNDTEYKGYVFDGQLSIVEEYLKVEPEKKALIKELVTDKRLYIGPWYTQADSLLVHKESLVRNLLYGVLGAEAFGHSMNVGYLPDIFGQNTYLPSLFKGFGIEYSVLQRGIYTDELNGDLHFNWESPDKKSVKSTLIPLGYGPGKFLEADETYRNEMLYPLIDKISQLSQHTNHILFPSGGDQVLIREHFPETVKQLNQLHDDNTYILSDYESYMEETWDDELFTHTIKGELIGTQLSRMHRTIRSQRYDIKLWNDKVEHKLINQLEPLAVIGEQKGLKYPKARIDELWKALFDVHSHDSIGGCNSDETNQTIVERLKKINRQIDGLMNIIKKQLTQAIVTKNKLEKAVVVFNTSAKKSEQTFEVTLFTREEQFELTDNKGQSISFSLIDQTYMDGGKKIQVTDKGEQEISLPGYYKNQLIVDPIPVPALGYTTILINEMKAENKDNQQEIEAIENDQVKLFVRNHSLVLWDKETNTEINDFITFEETADAGDSYDYSPLVDHKPIYITQTELLSVSQYNQVQKMTMMYEGRIPYNLKARKGVGKSVNEQPLNILTTIELRPGESFLRVTHKLNNSAKDHRVRVCLNTSINQALHSYGDQGYSLIERPLIETRLADWKENGYKEAPVPIYTVERFMGLKGEDTAVTVFTKGIKEYEILTETNQVALTLFRSVGLLGRDNLQWRPGRASGINNKVVETPKAQMIGEWTFNYAVQIGNLTDQELFEKADQFNEQIVCYQNQTLNTFEERLDRFEIPYPVKELPLESSLINISNKDIFISSIKKAEQEQGVVLRLYNPSANEVSVEVESNWFTTQYLTDLKETKYEEVKDKICISAKGYQTVLMKSEGS